MQTGQVVNETAEAVFDVYPFLSVCSKVKAFHSCYQCTSNLHNPKFARLFSYQMPGTLFSPGGHTCRAENTRTDWGVRM